MAPVAPTRPKWSMTTVVSACFSQSAATHGNASGLISGHIAMPRDPAMCQSFCIPSHSVHGLSLRAPIRNPRTPCVRSCATVLSRSTTSASTTATAENTPGCARTALSSEHARLNEDSARHARGFGDCKMILRGIARGLGPVSGLRPDVNVGINESSLRWHTNTLRENV
jgi:hypothetical protein